MVPVWGRLLIKVADLVVYSSLAGEILVILNARVICSWFCFLNNTTHALEYQEGIQGFDIGEDGVFTAKI